MGDSVKRLPPVPPKSVSTRLNATRVVSASEAGYGPNTAPEAPSRTTAVRCACSAAGVCCTTRSATCYPTSVESKLNADEFHFPAMQVQEKG